MSKEGANPAAEAECQLRKLNAAFAKWVAVQIEENPVGDWSIACTEYAEFVKRIKETILQEIQIASHRK